MAQVDSKAALAALSTDELIRTISHTLMMGQCSRRYPDTVSMYELTVEMAYRVKREDEALIDVVAEILALLADHLREVQSA